MRLPVASIALILAAIACAANVPDEKPMWEPSGREAYIEFNGNGVRYPIKDGSVFTAEELNLPYDENGKCILTEIQMGGDLIEGVRVGGVRAKTDDDCTVTITVINMESPPGIHETTNSE